MSDINDKYGQKSDKNTPTLKVMSFWIYLGYQSADIRWTVLKDTFVQEYLLDIFKTNLK
jgi:hypothetical protein